MSEKVNILDNSKERISLELMQIIADAEFGKDDRKENSPREYYLKLYAQCINTVTRHSYKEEQ